MYQGMENAHLICGNGADTARLAPERVGACRLVITSPPYHNAISYDRHTTDAHANHRARTTLDYAHDYLPLLDSVWDACHTMLAPGGVLAINVGSVLQNGYHHPLPQDILHRCLNPASAHANRWTFIRSLIWHKVTGGVRRAGSVIKHRLPGYWYPNIMTEHILLLQKPGADLVVNQGALPSAWHANFWDIAPVPPRASAHPAPFPEEIPHRLILLFTHRGEWVLDPFCGSGTTIKAALQLERRGLGLDLQADYIALAERRLAAPPAVRPKQLQIRAVAHADFTPRPPSGRTRHGAGLGRV